MLRGVLACLPPQTGQPLDTRKQYGRRHSAGIVLSHWYEHHDLIAIFHPLTMFLGHTSCHYKGRNLERVFYKGRNHDLL
jgi:hypothetical protein